MHKGESSKADMGIYIHSTSKEKHMEVGVIGDGKRNKRAVKPPDRWK